MDIARRPHLRDAAVSHHPQDDQRRPSQQRNTSTSAQCSPPCPNGQGLGPLTQRCGGSSPTGGVGRFASPTNPLHAKLLPPLEREVRAGPGRSAGDCDQKKTPTAHPDLIQGPAGLYSAGLATEICTHRKPEQRQILSGFPAHCLSPPKEIEASLKPNVPGHTGI